MDVILISYNRWKGTYTGKGLRVYTPDVATRLALLSVCLEYNHWGESGILFSDMTWSAIFQNQRIKLSSTQLKHQWTTQTDKLVDKKKWLKILLKKEEEKCYDDCSTIKRPEYKDASKFDIWTEAKSFLSPFLKN